MGVAAPSVPGMPCQDDWVIEEVRGNNARQEADFTAFFHTYFALVRSHVRRLGHDDGTVEDICSGVFTLAHERFDELAPLAEPQIRAWLFRTGDLIGRNHRRSAIRYRRLIERLEREPLAEQVTPPDRYDDMLARDHAAARTRHVLAALDGRHRTVLELADLQQFSGPEVAARLGITHQAARLRLMRARRAFRREYERRYGTRPVEGRT